MKTQDLLFLKMHLSGSNLAIRVCRRLSSVSERRHTLLWNLKVCYNGKVLFESGFTDKRNFSLPLTNTGSYIVFLQAKRDRAILYHIRDSIWYYTDKEKAEYRQFLTSYQPEKHSPLPLAALPSPYQNLAAVFFHHADEQNRLDEKVRQAVSPMLVKKLSMDDGTTIALFSQSEPFVSARTQTVAFSGKAKYAHHLVIGQADIPADADISQLSDTIGQFSIFYGDSKHFEITNDYFGIDPLYVYQGSDISVVANSFHLCVLLAKMLGLPLALDVKNILPYFVTGERMLFEQLASHQSFIQQIRKIPIHAKCVYDAGKGLQFPNKPIGDLMCQDTPFQADQYQSLLRSGIQEVTDNIRCIMDDPRVEHVIIDVSGGKDSRVVLGALLNCDISSKQVCVRSADVVWKKDKAAFIPLNHLHNLPYDTLPEEYHIDDKEKKDLAYRSYHLGTLFNRSIPWQMTSTRNSSIQEVRLTGAGGDMLLCPYFPMSFSSYPCDSDRHLAEAWAPGYNNGLINYRHIRKAVTSIIRQGLSEVRGRDTYDRFNNYYLYFRNAYHFGPESIVSEMDTQQLQWTPLYSKSLFAARQMASHQYKGIRIALDLLDMLQPSFLKLPFNDPSYNKELAKLVQADPALKEKLDKLDVRIDHDETQWQQAAELKQQNETVVLDADVQSKNLAMDAGFYAKCISRLNQVLHYDRKFERMLGLDLYVFLNKNQSAMQSSDMSRNCMIVYNKLTTVTDLIDLLAASREECATIAQNLQ